MLIDQAVRFALIGESVGANAGLVAMRHGVARISAMMPLFLSLLTETLV
jgi:hypothetical protein